MCISNCGKERGDNWWGGVYLIGRGFVVPTTTPPLVWPYNGKNKGAPAKFFESYTYGGFLLCKYD